MILKASQRGGGYQLAQHLLRTDENEHLSVHDIRGFAANDVKGAFKEAYSASRATRCKQFLFSVSLNPPQQESVPVTTFEDAIQRIEDKNGLTGQPRVVIFHEKEGRRHAHAVWSRIDSEKMTARNLPHFKIKLRNLSREIYLEQGWKMPRGLMNSREADPRNCSLDEWYQAKRNGENARDLKEILQECWAVSDSKKAFVQAIEARGMALAKGDRRGHVVITGDGSVLSVARYTGKQAKAVRERLGEPDALPSVDAAKSKLATELFQTNKRHVREAEQKKQHALAPLEQRRRAMVVTQQRERADLKARQEERWTFETKARAARFDKGLKGLWHSLTGKNAAIQKRNLNEAYASLKRDREQTENLIAAQLEQRRSLQAEIQQVRERHAALLRELRTEKTAIKALESNAKSAFDRPQSPKSAAQKTRPARSTTNRPPSNQEGLKDLRSRTRRPRGKDNDRER